MLKSRGGIQLVDGAMLSPENSNLRHSVPPVPPFPEAAPTPELTSLIAGLVKAEALSPEQGRALTGGFPPEAMAETLTPLIRIHTSFPAAAQHLFRAGALTRATLEEIAQVAAVFDRCGLLPVYQGVAAHVEAARTHHQINREEVRSAFLANGRTLRDKHPPNSLTSELLLQFRLIAEDIGLSSHCFDPTEVMKLLVGLGAVAQELPGQRSGDFTASIIGSLRGPLRLFHPIETILPEEIYPAQRLEAAAAHEVSDQEHHLFAEALRSISSPESAFACLTPRSWAWLLRDPVGRAPQASGVLEATAKRCASRHVPRPLFAALVFDALSMLPAEADGGRDNETLLCAAALVQESLRQLEAGASTNQTVRTRHDLYGAALPLLHSLCRNWHLTPEETPLVTSSLGAVVNPDTQARIHARALTNMFTDGLIKWARSPEQREEILAAVTTIPGATVSALLSASLSEHPICLSALQRGAPTEVSEALQQFDRIRCTAGEAGLRAVGCAVRLLNRCLTEPPSSRPGALTLTAELRSLQTFFERFGAVELPYLYLSWKAATLGLSPMTLWREALNERQLFTLPAYTRYLLGAIHPEGGGPHWRTLSPEIDPGLPAEQLKPQQLARQLIARFDSTNRMQDAQLVRLSILAEGVPEEAGRRYSSIDIDAPLDPGTLERWWSSRRTSALAGEMLEFSTPAALGTPLDFEAAAHILSLLDTSFPTPHAAQWDRATSSLIPPPPAERVFLHYLEQLALDPPAAQTSPTPARIHDFQVPAARFNEPSSELLEQVTTLTEDLSRRVCAYFMLPENRTAAGTAARAIGALLADEQTGLRLRYAGSPLPEKVAVRDALLSRWQAEVQAATSCEDLLLAVAAVPSLHRNRAVMRELVPALLSFVPRDEVHQSLLNDGWGNALKERVESLAAIAAAAPRYAADSLAGAGLPTGTLTAIAARAFQPDILDRFLEVSTSQGIPEDPVPLRTAPSRGFSLKMLGYISDTCATRVHHPGVDRPNMTFYPFLDPTAPAHAPIACGGTGVLLVTGSDGRMAGLIRGFNPRPELLRKVDAGALFEQVVDCIAEDLAAAGVDRILVPRDLQVNLTLTNRDPIFRHVRRHYFEQAPTYVTLREPEQALFNKVGIPERCVVIRERKDGAAGAH